MQGHRSMHIYCTPPKGTHPHILLRMSHPQSHHISSPTHTHTHQSPAQFIFHFGFISHQLHLLPQPFDLFQQTTCGFLHNTQPHTYVRTFTIHTYHTCILHKYEHIHTDTHTVYTHTHTNTRACTHTCTTHMYICSCLLLLFIQCCMGQLS